jgi:hypothetical protein
MRRAAIDADFRAKCLRDARGAVKEVSGLEVHAAASVRFAEPQEGLVVTLPPLSHRSRELSDADLDSVAGGKKCILSLGDDDNNGTGWWFFC